MAVTHSGDFPPRIFTDAGTPAPPKRPDGVMISRGSIVLSLIFSLTLMVTLAASILYYTHQEREKDRLRAQIRTRDEQISALRAEYGDLRAERDRLYSLTGLSGLLADIDVLKKDIEDLLARPQYSSFPRRDIDMQTPDWEGPIRNTLEGYRTYLVNKLDELKNYSPVRNGGRPAPGTMIPTEDQRQ